MTLPQYGQPIARMNPIDLSDLTGIVITAPVAGDLLVYDGATWRNRTVTGDVTINNLGVTAITPGAIVNADINAAAVIAVTKLALGGVNSVLWSNGVVNSWASNPTLQQLTVDNLRFDGNIFNSLAGDIVINAFSGDLDVSNNDIENIGAAGNDFRAAQLDLVAGYIILGANVLNLLTTAGDLVLNPFNAILVMGSKQLRFGASNAFINRLASGRLHLSSTTDISLTTPLINLSAGAVLAGLGVGANGFIIKNPKNAAASALSGTQLDVEMDIGGTPYHWTVYPTKA